MLWNLSFFRDSDCVSQKPTLASRLYPILTGMLASHATAAASNAFCTGSRNQNGAPADPTQHEFCRARSTGFPLVRDHFIAKCFPSIKRGHQGRAKMLIRDSDNIARKACEGRQRHHGVSTQFVARTSMLRNSIQRFQNSFEFSRPASKMAMREPLDSSGNTRTTAVSGTSARLSATATKF